MIHSGSEPFDPGHPLEDTSELRESDNNRQNQDAEQTTADQKSSLLNHRGPPFVVRIIQACREQYARTMPAG